MFQAFAKRMKSKMMVMADSSNILLCVFLSALVVLAAVLLTGKCSFFPNAQPSEDSPQVQAGKIEVASFGSLPLLREGPEQLTGGFVPGSLNDVQNMKQEPSADPFREKEEGRPHVMQYPRKKNIGWTW